MVNGIIEAGYLNQGQICAAAERFYLPQGKLDAVLALLKDKLSAFAPGSPLDERTLMGPLANRQQYDKVLRLIQTARDEGDTIVCGGEALPGEGYFLQPTAVKVRSEESTLMREETFGPVCSFIGYRSEEEALARMNAHRMAWRPASGRIIFVRRYATRRRLRPASYGSICIPSSTRRTVRRHEGLGHRARIRQRVYR